MGDLAKLSVIMSQICEKVDSERETKKELKMIVPGKVKISKSILNGFVIEVYAWA